MNTQNLSTLKIHKLTQDQYDRELAAGNIDENALYLTPNEEIDLTPYATKEELKTKSDVSHAHDDRYYTEEEVDTLLSSKSNATHNHDSSYDSLGAADDALATAKSYTDTKVSSYETKTDASSKLAEAKTYTDTVASGKSDVSHNHDENYDSLGSADDAFVSAKSYTDTKVSPLASTSSVNTSISTHNTSTEAHNDIRALITSLTTKLNNFLDVDDTTTDQLSEVLELINNNKGTLESLTTSKISVSDIVNNLTTNSASKVLSAAQGVTIKSLIDTLEAELDSHTHAISEVTGLQSALDGKAASSHGTHVTYSTTAPVMDGTASVGTASTVARSDHKHPTDTSRASQTDLDALTTVVSGKANSSHTHTIANVTNLQTSLDAKQSTITGGASTITSSNLTTSRALISNSSGKVAVSDVTSTELGYLDGVTSNVQTQLDNKLNTSGGTVTGGVTFKVTPAVTKTIDGVEHSSSFGVNSSGKTYMNHKTDGTEDNWLILTSETSSTSKPWTVSSGGTGAKTAEEARTNLGAAPSGYGAGDAGTTITGTDLLDVLASCKSGLYRGKNVANAPNDDSGWWYFDVLCDSSTYSIVHAYNYAQTVMAYGSYRNGTFDGWKFSSYAGSSSVGGAATSANKLNTNAGDSNTPVYFSNGVPVACTSLDLNTTGSSASCTGNAATATKATQDASGNTITSTYMRKNDPTGDGVVSIGRKSDTELGNRSIAMGCNATASNAYAVAIGNQAKATGIASVAIGHLPQASNYYSFATGSNTISSGESSTAMGASTTASGSWSTAMGCHTTALDYQVSMGWYNHQANAAANTSQYGTGSGTAFVIGNGTSSSNSNAFRVDYNGKPYGKSAYTTSGCDYAEYFEWLDFNPDNEDRRGYFVTLDGEKIKIAEPGDYILGIISGHPAVIGNGDEDWMGRYILDDFGEFIYEDFEYEAEEPEEVVDEETGEVITQIKKVKRTCKKYKENPDYDPSITYIQREDRPEWDAVGMVGVLSVRDDGTCQINGYCKVAEGGTATASDSGYRVVKRVNESIVRVIFK